MKLKYFKINKYTKTNKTMAFTIDFLELMLLSESIIPPNPIAHSMAFDDLSEKHYHQMTPEQREQMFNHVQKQHGFNLENEQCRHFFARFNPKNQYIVKAFHLGKGDEYKCYYFNERYHTSISRSVNEEYIKSITRIHDNLKIK